MNKKVHILIILLLLLIPISTYAQEKQQTKDDLFNLSIEEFLNVEIVSASKFGESAKKTPATTVVITRDDIKAYGYTHVNEIIENIPGFYTIDDLAFNGPVAGVRGYWSGNSRNVIILVNGIRSIDNYSSGYRLRDIPIPVEAIDRIEVVRGPLSVIYGSGAFYGVINIITDEINRNEVALSYGSLNTSNLSIKIANGEKDKFRYSFSGAHYYTHGMNHKLTSMGSNIPVNIPQNTSGRLENRETYFNFSSEFDGFVFKINYFENPREIYFFNPSASEGYLNRQTGMNLSVGYNKKISNLLSINSKIIYSKQVLRAEADYFNRTYYGKENIETEGIEGEINALISFNKKLNLTTGINSRMITDIYDPFDHPRLIGDTYIPGVSNTITRLDDNDNILTLAGFAQLSFNLINNLNIVTGVGLEKNFGYDMLRINGGGSVDPDDYQELIGSYEQQKTYIIPRLGAIYEFNDKNTLKILYGEAINNPSFQQNWTQFVFETYGTKLKQERIKTLELNYIAIPIENMSINLSLFRNKLNQLITRTHGFDNEGNYITYNSNAGEIVTHGGELLIKVEPVRNFRTELSFTYQESENKSKGYENVIKAYSPNLLGYFKASYKLKKVSLALTSTYVDEMETYWDLATQNTNGSYGARIGEKVDSYFKLSANVNIEDIFNKGFYVGVKAYNILDKEIRYPTFTNNRWADKGTLGKGSLFQITMGKEF